MQKTQFVFLVPVAIALSLPIWLTPDHVAFRDIGITKVMELLTLLLFIALFLERALEVFVLTLRGPDEARLGLEVKELENKLNNPKKDQSDTEKAELDKAFEKSKLKRIEYKSETRRIALWIGLTLGILISAVGIQALQTLVDIDTLGSLSKAQLTAFRLMDVLLTGGIIAGGSEGIHKLISVYNSFMDASAKRAKGE